MPTTEELTNLSPEQIEEILSWFFDSTRQRQYVGARYLPILGRRGEDTIEWDNGAPYEQLTIVMHNNDTYTSRRYVPTGAEITDTRYWARTASFNAQVEQYRQEALHAVEVAEDAMDLARDAMDLAEGAIDLVKTNVRSFDTVTDMQAVTDLAAGMTCHTNGFHTAGDGGAAYYTVSASGTANGMDVLALQGELFATLVLEEMINVRQLGASDTLSDCSAYFNRAIELATSEVKNIFFPSGEYQVTNDLLNIPTNVRLIGNNSDNIFGVTTRISDKRTNGNYLINFVRIDTPDYSGANGGGIDGIAFHGNVLNHGCINNSVKATCWDGHFKNIVITSYNHSALNIDTHDCYYENVFCISCGDENHYCVEIRGGANMQKFYSCHWEMCRHIVHTQEQSYLNSFIDCKFEMDPPVGTSRRAPIHIQGTNTSTVQCSFINCEFVGLSIQCYMDEYLAAGMSVTYRDVPFMVDYDNVLNAQITGCKFVTGRGAETTQTVYSHQTRFLRCYDGVVSNCFFHDAAYLACGIYLGECAASNLDIILSDNIADFTSTPQQKYALDVNNNMDNLSNIVFRGTIADGYYPSSVISAGIKSYIPTRYVNRFVHAENTTGYITLVVKNMFLNSPITTWLKFQLEYKGILGIRGEGAFYYFVAANNVARNGSFKNVSLLGSDAPYNTIDAYFVNGDVYLQIPTRSTDVMFNVEGCYGYNAFAYIDKSITEAITNYDGHIQLTL